MFVVLMVQWFLCYTASRHGTVYLHPLHSLGFRFTKGTSGEYALIVGVDCVVRDGDVLGLPLSLSL